MAAVPSGPSIPPPTIPIKKKLYPQGLILMECNGFPEYFYCRKLFLIFVKKYKLLIK
jgi:hypothetical protein